MEFEKLAPLIGTPAAAILYVWWYTRGPKPPDATAQIGSVLLGLISKIDAIYSRLGEVQNTVDDTKTGIEVLKDRGKR